MTKGFYGKGINSTQTLVTMASAQEIPIPPSVQLQPDAAQFWPVYTASRMPDQWRDVDLMMVGSLCNMEADIRRYRDMLSTSPPVIMTAKGAKENPLFGIIHKLVSEQLAVMRSLSMSTPSNLAPTFAAGAAKGRQLRSAMNTGDGLLAGS